MKVTNLGPFGPIDVKKFPIAPEQPPVGYRWVDGGVVKLLPTSMCRADREFDPNTLINDEENFKKILINMKNAGFDYTDEPGYFEDVVDPETNEIYYEFISSRTRLRIFKDQKQGAFYGRQIEKIPGFNHNTAKFNASFEADISHRHRRQLTYIQIAQFLSEQKGKEMGWYQDQTRDHFTGKFVYGWGEFEYWYDHIGKIQRQFDADMKKKIWNKLQSGFSTTEKINTVSKPQVKSEFLESDSIKNRKSDINVSIVCMDNPQANAPAAAFPIMKEIKSKKKTVYCLYTNAAKNAEEVIEFRQQWRDSIVQKVSEMAEFFLDGEVAEKYKTRIKEDKMKEFFDNFELWSYNHLTDESEMIKIAI